MIASFYTADTVKSAQLKGEKFLKTNVIKSYKSTEGLCRCIGNKEVEIHKF